MSTIQEILRKQAELVRANSNKIIEAQKLEAAAAKLRAEANAPVKMGYAEIAAQKMANGEKFAGIIHSLRNKQNKPVTNTKPVATTFKSGANTQTPILKKVKAAFNYMADAELQGPLLDLFRKYKNDMDEKKSGL